MEQTKKKRRRVPKFINLDLWYEASVHDIKTGKLIRHRKGRCHSFVAHFLMVLNMSMAGYGRPFDYVNTSGTSRTGSSGLRSTADLQGSLTSSSGVDTTGVQVGTNNTAPTVTDAKLNTKVSHGTSSGQLQYGAVTFGAPSVSGSDCTWIATRIFTNGSGGTVTVKEIGLVLSNVASSFGDNILIARDAVSDIAILNGQALTLNYTFKTTA